MDLRIKEDWDGVRVVRRTGDEVALELASRNGNRVSIVLAQRAASVLLEQLQVRQS